MDWNSYSKRLMINGATRRERNVNQTNNNILKNAPSNPSYKDVKLNGVDIQLVINTGTKPYYKEFETLHGQKILTGDYVEWKNQTWLVYDADCDDEVYIDGNLRQCQHKIFWQNSDGKILSRYVWTQNASAYNNGETGNSTITLQSNQFMVYLPYDEDTCLLDNGLRVHMSKVNNHTCKPYILTRPDDVTYGYGEKGVLNIIFTQTQFNAQSDKRVTLEDGSEVWICDYHSPTDPPTPQEPNETTDLWYMKLDYKSSVLKPTNAKTTITAHLYNEKSEEVVDNIMYMWCVTSDIDTYITYSSDGNELTISLSDRYEDSNDEIVITCASEHTGQSVSTIMITKGVF